MHLLSSIHSLIKPVTPEMKLWPALCNNIKAVTPETWEAIHRILVAYAQDKRIEKGKQVRIDCTVVSSNIHEPTDSSILWDCVRVLTRMPDQINERFDELDIPFSEHTKRAQRRMLEIMNAKGKKVREKKYEDLLKVTHMTLNYALNAVSLLDAHCINHCSLSATAQELTEELKEIIRLTHRVIDQTSRGGYQC
jgi:IS5 family transposase